MPYRPSGGGKLDEWLRSEPAAALRLQVVQWLMDLMQNPDAVVPAATPVPGQRLPVVTTFVPEPMWP